MSLVNKIKEYGLKLGFDLIGIAPVDEIPHWQEYDEWVENGYAGEMDYMKINSEKRKDPRAVLPDARSIIAVAKNYYTDKIDTASDTEDELRGWISRYAWGNDYHEVIKDGLVKLLDFIKNEVGDHVEGKIYVDTGPLLDREIANRAGIGWFGKNTNIINQTIGSWLFLGEILINIQMDYDSPVPDRCGTCTRCIRACPTNAFVAPYILDSRKCVSYLTIELKGSIPETLRPLMANNVYGCDICQDVCPWNRKVTPSDDGSFWPREGLAFPSLLSLLQLQEEEYHSMFKGSPIKRTKRRGLLRNIAVALGNAKNENAVPALANAIQDPESLVRSHAAWALGEIGGDAAKAVLKQRLNSEDHVETVEEIKQALDKLN